MKTKIEFNRILKPDGHIVLVWNVRKEQDDFQKEYESNLTERFRNTKMYRTEIFRTKTSQNFSLPEHSIKIVCQIFKR